MRLAASRIFWTAGSKQADQDGDDGDDDQEFDQRERRRERCEASEPSSADGESTEMRTIVSTALDRSTRQRKCTGRASFARVD